MLLYWITRFAPTSMALSVIPHNSLPFLLRFSPPPSSASLFRLCASSISPCHRAYSNHSAQSHPTHYLLLHCAYSNPPATPIRIPIVPTRLLPMRLSIPPAAPPPTSPTLAPPARLLLFPNPPCQLRLSPVLLSRLCQLRLSISPTSVPDAAPPHAYHFGFHYPLPLPCPTSPRRSPSHK